MKEKCIILIALVLFSMHKSNGQASTLGNSGSGTNYVGWNSFQTFPLTIKHEADYPINLQTNTGAGGLAKIRMQISNTTINAPTGASFEVGRVQIRENPTNPNIQPLSLLHLGNAWIYNTGGHRSWMDVGTFTTAGGDNMYVGLKLETEGQDASPWNDHMDAVINWGDNVANPDNFNDLRFIFTSTSTTLDSDGPNGLEMGRFSCNGNFGVGNFYNPASPWNPNRPARRLEVLDGARNEPQLRLTHTQQNGVNTGAYTDFQSLSTGDLRINPKFNAGNRYVGINTATALTTTLQLGANAANQSGLRFENLTFASPSITRAANTNKVLSLDNSGNVILVDDNEGSGGGTPSTADNGLSYAGSNIQLGGPLTHNTSIGLNNYAFKFTGPIFGGQTTRWNIDEFGRQKSWCSQLSGGTAWDYYVPFASSNAVQNGINLYSSANTSSANIGFNNQILNDDNSGGEITAYNASLVKDNYNKRYIAYSSSQQGFAYDNQSFYGRIVSTSAPTNENAGVNLEIAGARNSIGASSLVYSSENAYGYSTKIWDIANLAFGVRADVSANENVFGVWARASNGNSINYAIYGEASPGNCNPSPGSCTQAAGYFNGDVFGINNYIVSDKKLKSNINPLTNPWQILNAIEPKSYEFDSLNYPSINLPHGLHYGLIAQEIEQVLPNLVKNLKQPEVKDSLGNTIYPQVDFKALNYVELIPFLIAALKEEKQTVDSIKNILQSSNIRVNSSNKQKIELSNNMGIILEQNDPNPFAEKTVINYLIPAEVKHAKIIFSDNNGVIIKTAEIESRGSGSLEVFSSQLSAGIYLYSLICDNKLIETKKMIKSE